MDINIVVIIATTIIVVAGFIAVMRVGPAAFSREATELGKEESELFLRVGVVSIIVVAAILFGAMGKLGEAIPFLSPVAAFVLGGVKAPRK